MKFITIHRIDDLYGSGRVEMKVNPATIIAARDAPTKSGTGTKLALPVVGEIWVEESLSEILALAEEG